MNRDDALVLAALNAGAAKACIIPDENVILNRAFYDICASNSCGRFGKCWMCPPDIGTIDELMARVRGFNFGLLYQTIGALEDSFDIEGMEEAARRHAQVSQNVDAQVKALLNGNIFHLSCGGCNLCERCAKLDDLPCRLPEKALMPMEGAGIDVYNTTKGTPLKYINGAYTVTYFGLVLFEEREVCRI